MASAPRETGTILRRTLVQSVIGFVALAALLLLPAGSWRWPQAWMFLALIVLGSTGSTVWMWRHDRDLLAARLQSPLRRDQQPRDRAIVAAMLACFAAWFVAMGLVRRFRGPGAPLWAQCLGAALIVLAFAGWLLVLRANSFAATNIRVQPERHHAVATTGPYAVVRHPMYAAALLFFAGAPLLLDIPAGLWGIAVMLPLLVLRTRGEEAVLMAGLPGYPAYAAQVRWRLVPGLW